MVRSFKFLLSTQQTLKGGGEVYHRCYGDYILYINTGRPKGRVTNGQNVFFSYQFMRRYLILYNLINILIWKFKVLITRTFKNGVYIYPNFSLRLAQVMYILLEKDGVLSILISLGVLFIGTENIDFAHK